MAKVKYRVREYTPTANQGGTHSFFAEAATDVTADPTDGDDDNTQTGGSQTPSGELEG